ncbi:smf Mn2+ and Fe2+ transporter [Artomyces pyxidatus]|uniref:Smf Mn2+ and Fe2+ transporter n=1 Tax=Artomyces pyxidatus TaxID=48021 RepID=A0ACB8SSC2_9AGAM|nr:smf Mn2+ and Fe2+ transporter [Artomyces pyxidatus]
MSPPASSARDDRPTKPPRTCSARLATTAETVCNHVVKHTGVGVVCAVAYFDPGNWGVDLQAGSQFGYKLLFIVLVSGLFAVVLQCLASKLGIVTGLDLASHCRLLLYNRPKHTRLYRWLALYPLYVLSEIAIISTDLAELIGSAIALNLLFPKLPLWAGVLLTALDVLLILACGDPLLGRPAKMFELLIASLVIAVLVCMCIIISKVHVDWGQAFDGFVPSKAIFEHGGLYTSVGILGATVMPHSLFLGSALSTQDRVSPAPAKSTSIESLDNVSATINDPITDPKNHSERENNSWQFVQAHLSHGIVDVVVSLLGLAVIINSLILILASSVFYYGDGGYGARATASLFDAHALLEQLVGRGAAVTFALALLCAGQSASIVATVAGQTISQGFLRWHVSPLLRRFLTRILGLIPSMIVAVAVGRSGIDTMLVASQVVLSIVLPFIVLPLLYFTSSRTIMRVRKPTAVSADPSSQIVKYETTDEAPGAQLTDVEDGEPEYLDFSNGWILAGFGYFIWLIIVVANAYVLITLMMGDS